MNVCDQSMSSSGFQYLPKLCIKLNKKDIKWKKILGLPTETELQSHKARQHAQNSFSAWRNQRAPPCTCCYMLNSHIFTICAGILGMK